MDPRGGNYGPQARPFAPRAVIDGVALAEAQEQLAWAVLGAVLVAGLLPYNIEAAADGEETGGALVPEGHGALRVVWQQDPAAARHLPCRAARCSAGCHEPGVAHDPVRPSVLDRRRPAGRRSPRPRGPPEAAVISAVGWVGDHAGGHQDAAAAGGAGGHCAANPVQAM
jgi:hypothetical protein